MPKHARKKQRLESEVQPLGSVLHLDENADKDDEELRLESLLFGTDFRPSEKGKGREANFLVVSDDEDEENPLEGAGNAMEHLQDADVSTNMLLFNSLVCTYGIAFSYFS